MKQTIKKNKKILKKRHTNKHFKKGGMDNVKSIKTVKSITNKIKPITKKKKIKLVIVDELPEKQTTTLESKLKSLIRPSLPKKIETMEMNLKTPTQKIVEMELPTGRLNEKFIDLMEKLSNAVVNQGENANERMKSRFKSRAYKKAQETIMEYPNDIFSPAQLKGQPGIGDTILEKLNEYVTTGKLRLLEREKENPINLLAEVYGIGAVKAKELVDKGITNLDQLRERQDELLNDIQKVGLKYHDDIMRRIPREEIAKYDSLFSVDFNKIVGSFPNAHDSRFEIVGSYRRGAENSGDIDMIITSTDKNVFKAFIDMLIQQHIIIEVLARGPTKCLVIAKLHDEQYSRRIDFLYATPHEYPFAVLYFTGSKHFNTSMRKRAQDLGYSLNEHEMSKMENKIKGIKHKKGEKISHIFKNEKDIFDFLGMEYKTPVERIDGRSIVITEVIKPHKISSPPTILENIGNMVNSIIPFKKVEKTIENVVEKVTKKPKKPRTLKQKLKIVEDAVNSIEAAIPLIPQNILSPLNNTEKIIIKKKSKSTKEPKEPKETKEKTIKKTSKKHKIKLVINMDMDNKEHKLLSLIENFKKSGIHVLEQLTEDQLVSIINACDKTFHYNKEPLMSDMQYDIIKEYTENKYPDNPIFKLVGASVEKNKVTLPYEMASMDKIKPDTAILNTWKQKFSGPYVLSCKLDGVSGLYSTEGQKPKLYTRGNGKVGQDVSHLIPLLKLPKTKGVVVRGEFIMPKTTFEEKYATKFANIRNLVAGIVNRQSIDEKASDLHFVAYEVIKPELKPSEQMEFLISNSFETVQHETVNNITNEKLSEVLMEWRKAYIYEIDGIIVTDNKIYSRKSGNPDHAFAFKMVLSDQMAEAKVVDVIWTPSKDGYLKPRVQIEPIKLGGVTIEYATGFNAAFIEKNKIGVGSLIQIIRSGDVIPHIRGVTVQADEAKMPDVPYKWNDTHIDVMLEDVGSNMTVLEKNLTGFFRGISVDGLSSGNIARIVAAGYNTAPKIIHMSKEDFLKIEGFKEKLATKIYDGIRDAISKASLVLLMSVSNIFGRGISEKKIEPILEQYPDILISQDSKTEKINKVMKVRGMAKKSAEAFVENIPAFLEFIHEAGIEYKLDDDANGLLKTEGEQDITHPLYKKNVVMTGIRDDAIKQVLKNVGANLATSISKNTFVVIARSKDEDTSKANEARQLGIPIMTPAEFMLTYFHKESD